MRTTDHAPVDRTVSAAARVRYFTLVFRPARGLVHPVDDALGATAGVTREALSHVGARRDGTAVLLYRLRGDPAALEDVLGERVDVIRYGTIGARADAFRLYLHVRVADATTTLDERVLEHGLVVDPPVAFAGQDGLRVTVVGTPEMVRGAMEHLPAGVGCSIERLGGEDDDRLLLSALTDRQREVIETAFEMGYYEIPRRTTHEDIAGALDLSGSTVDEHLRKAECRLMEQILS